MSIALPGTTTMRTLIDLLNNDQGYVRIYADPAGYGYERCSYAPLRVSDLFDRMNGYASIDIAQKAAQLQLQALSCAKRRRKKSVA